MGTKPDPTIVVGYAGGYCEYRLSKRGALTEFFIEHRSIDELGFESDWEEIETFETSQEAWDYLGQLLGWKESDAETTMG